MKFGRFEVSTHNFGFFRLDGGSMFGAVPKNIWSKLQPGDEDNCIKLATRSLLIKDGARTFLVDLGCGEKWSDKERKIFAINNFPVSELGFEPASVTDVILTHMHFDHCGGISRWKDPNAPAGEREIIPNYPNATHYIQEGNLEIAKNPCVREKASYLKDNVNALELVKTIKTKGSQEIHPGIWVHEANGHTTGQQWIEVSDGTRSIVYPTDLIPTTGHVPVPYHMGYDMWAYRILVEKEDFLAKAMAKDSIVVFQHDPLIAAATITKDQRGHYAIKETLSF